MADPSNDEKFDKGKEKQVIGGQQSHRSEYGEQADQTDGSSGQPIGGNDSRTGSGTPLTSGSEPPRSMGTHGDEFGHMADHDRSGQQGQSGTGQADLGIQAGSTLAGRSDLQDIADVDPPASYGGGIEGRQSNSEGEGFILQQGSGSDDLQQRRSASSAKATDGTDFARDGRGAPEDDHNSEGPAS
jgi:hypothetical protein